MSAWLAAADLVLALLLPAPSPQAGDAAVEKALCELRAGTDVDANVARLLAAVEQGKDPGALAAQPGTTLFRESRLAAAQPFLELARARWPADGAVAVTLGRVHAMQYHFVEAVDALEAAARLLPPGPRPILHDTIAKALSGLRRHDDAFAEAKRALDDVAAWNAAPPAGQPRLDPADYELTRVTILEDALRHDEAMATLDALAARSLAPAKRAAVETARAKILDARGDEAAATKAFEAALVAAPNDPAACYEFATFRVRRGAHEPARALLEKVVALDPRHEGAWFNLARTRLRLRDHTGGDAAMARYRELHAESIAADERLTAIHRALAAKKGG